MNEMKDRQEGFERKFAHDEELRFKAAARRNKALGLWAAEKLGKSGAEAEAYPRSGGGHIEEAGDHESSARSQGFRCGGRRSVRPPNPPHHGRVDGAAIEDIKNT